MSAPVAILEWRSYLAVRGHEDDLLRRFHEHTFELFAEHGIEVVTFGRDRKDPRRLEYVVRWASPVEMEQGWARFLASAAWASVKEESERDGPLIERIDRRTLDEVDHRTSRTLQ